MKEFRVSLPIEYRPVIKKLSKELGLSTKKFLKVILVLYIKELNEGYYEEIKEELGLK